MKKLMHFGFTILILFILFYILNRKFDFIHKLQDMTLENHREKYIEQIRQGLLDGKEKVVIRCLGNSDQVQSFAAAAPQEAFTIDDKKISSDFDYLQYKYKGMRASVKGYAEILFVVTYHFDYLESKEETEAVNRRVNKVLQQLKLGEKTEVEKVRIIHDYIIKNTDYDLTISKNCAYNALIDKNSACQGYASLVYKMLTEAGVDCRIIGGNALEEPHAWNIVKIDGLWYNLDCTWDDPVGAGSKNYIGYTYYLKSEEDFKDHQRDEIYNTEEFHKKHPMATDSLLVLEME